MGKDIIIMKKVWYLNYTSLVVIHVYAVYLSILHIYYCIFSSHN